MKAAIEATKKLIPSHYGTLLGERKAGSQWGRPFAESDWDLPWEEATRLIPDEVKIPGCRYFRLKRLKEYFPNATAGAVPLGDFSDEALAELRVVRGSHGLELSMPNFHTGVALEAWLILGDHEGTEVVFTAHPGKPLAPLSTATAVKGNNR
jgi:hypothetical protein